MNTRGPDAPRASASDVNSHANSAGYAAQRVHAAINHINAAKQLILLYPQIENPIAAVRATVRNLDLAISRILPIAEPDPFYELEEMHAPELHGHQVEVHAERDPDQLELVGSIMPRVERWSVTPAGEAQLARAELAAQEDA